MKCKICNNETQYIFQKNILLKYPVKYFRCGNCGFIQTEEVFWLKEAYESAITSLDIGILNRNKYLLQEIPVFIDTFFPDGKIFLDYAGGYGLFTRSMRDLGYNFFNQDPYCENLFAKYFGFEDADTDKFDVITAFEVFEHLDNPLHEIEEILKYGDNLIFSTDIIPEDSSVEDWIYIAHETGQHIAFYTEKSLRIIAEKFGKNYYRKDNLHIFTPKNLTGEQIDFAIHNVRTKKNIFGKIKDIEAYNIQRESYQHRDYLKIKEILRNNVK